MAIKVQFEIGHTATLKTKRSPEGFTHDWELYVQGVNKADISAFVDKVVFNLHDSFPRPKRSIKEPPYVIKESGYAGFVLNIDIYFRNRDEPKRVTYVYDLDLQNEGPPYHRCEIKKFIFEAPSEDFRQKLVKGGGIAVSAVVGGAIASEDKSLDMSVPDSRSQMVGKPKLSIDATSSSSSKKHKQRPDDSKLNTFANLFGTPITKSAPKFSPDPKTKTANGGAIGPTAPSVPGKGKDKSGSATGGAAAGTVLSGPVAGSGKDKEKAEKKDKHKQSPHKDKVHDEKESKKKSDGKHDKREEKKKEKKDKEKERERAKEKPSKRSLSPKSAAASAPSPKRPSPVRSSSAASRDDASAKSSSKTSESDKRGSSSSSGKKSKKEKKSHDKERDHKEKHRTDVKESVPVASVAPAIATAAPAVPGVQPSKPANTTVVPKTDLNSNKNQKASDKDKDKDTKKTDSKSSEKESTPVQASDKKSSTDKDKKSHKHKKKDKNKEKEKEKEKEKDKDQPSKKSTSSKDKKDKKEKAVKNESAAPTTTTSNSNSSAISKKSTATTDMDTPTETGSTKSTSSTVSGTSSAKIPSTTSKQSNNVAASTVPISNSTTTTNAGTALSASGLPTVLNDLSDVDSLNSESLHAISNSNSDKAAPIQNSDSSNSSFPEVPTPASKPAAVFQAPANPQPTPPTTPLATACPAAIAELPRAQAAPVVEKKNHRSGAEKSKAEKIAEKEDKKRRRNSTAGNTFVEPPLKQIKKDLKPAREKSQSPLLRTEEKQTFLPPPATTSTPPIQNTPVTALNLEYLSELQELHQKIMTLQDNEELQQVVEMIAATGRYEITSKTFDFDLCKLDRHTVQRLQDFFATSVS